MTMIQISEEKKEKLSEMCEKMLHYGGKIMQCLESLDEEGEQEYGMRDEEEYDGDDYRVRSGMRSGMRRGRNMMGRYSRY